MDALSEALKSVRMTGAIFFKAVCGAPWGFRVPRLQRIAHVLAPGTERLISYHLVTEGRAVVRFQGAGRDGDIVVCAGDIIVIPHGNPHLLFNGRPARLIDSEKALSRYLSGTLDTVRVDGGTDVTTFVCGYFGCDRHADRMFLAGLPTMIKMSIRGDARGAWLENSICHLVAEAEAGRPGQSVLLSKMAEALFIETLRRYMEELPPEQTGWLAGARDPVVGAALALLHRRPCHSWTLAALAKEVAASRSVLAERFAHLIGESPMSYLLRWRLELAARMLQTTTHRTIAQLALDVGYESEAAFNRAFKRVTGVTPGRWRDNIAPAIPRGMPPA